MGLTLSLNSILRPRDRSSLTITLNDSGVPDSKLLSPFDGKCGKRIISEIINP